MKKQLLIGTLLVAALALVCFLSIGRAPVMDTAEPREPGQTGSPKPVQQEPDIFSIAKAQSHLPADYVLTPEQREKILSRRDEILRKQFEMEMSPTDEEIGIMFETPVEFYGQVLDQFDNPVIGAKIRCTWGIYGQRAAPLEMKSSAPDGRFEILGLKALLITISVYPPRVTMNQ